MRVGIGVKQYDMLYFKKGHIGTLQYCLTLSVNDLNQPITKLRIEVRLHFICTEQIPEQIWPLRQPVPIHELQTRFLKFLYSSNHIYGVFDLEEADIHFLIFLLISTFYICTLESDHSNINLNVKNLNDGLYGLYIIYTIGIF